MRRRATSRLSCFPTDRTSPTPAWRARSSTTAMSEARPTHSTADAQARTSARPQCPPSTRASGRACRARFRERASARVPAGNSRKRRVRRTRASARRTPEWEVGAPSSALARRSPPEEGTHARRGRRPAHRAIARQTTRHPSSGVQRPAVPTDFRGRQRFERAPTCRCGRRGLPAAIRQGMPGRGTD